MVMYRIINKILRITDEHSARLRAGNAAHSADFGPLLWKTPPNSDQDRAGRVDRVRVGLHVLFRRGGPELLRSGETHDNRIGRLAGPGHARYIPINLPAPTLHAMLPDERSHSLPLRLPAQGGSAVCYHAMHQSRLQTGQALRATSVPNSATLLGLRSTAFQRLRLRSGIRAGQ
jgi:hypothetical protein